MTPTPKEKQILQDGQATHNYQTMNTDCTITLHCDEKDVSPLNHYEYLLLAGIQSLEACYQTFIAPDKLDWGSHLKVGDHTPVADLVRGCISVFLPSDRVEEKLLAHQQVANGHPFALVTLYSRLAQP